MSKDLLQVISDEHSIIRRLFKAAQYDSNNINELVRFLVAHEVAEEIVPFPRAEKIEGGKQIVNDRVEEQVRAEKELDDIEKMGSSKQKIDATKELEAKVLDHAAAEEQTVYKMLKQECSQKELDDMGKKFMKVKSLASKNTLADDSDTALKNSFLGSVATFADKIRDAASNLYEN